MTRLRYSLMVVALLSSPAAADPPAQEVVVKGPDRTVYEKRTVIDFGEKDLEGNLSRPEGSYVLERRASSFPSLLRLRQDFNPELRRSMDEL